jgi:hypothetical protein
MAAPATTTLSKEVTVTDRPLPASRGAVAGTRTIDITPSAEGQETLLALFAQTVVADVKVARREADIALLQQVVDLAFIAGYNAGRREAFDGTTGTTRQRLQDLVR